MGDFTEVFSMLGGGLVHSTPLPPPWIRLYLKTFFILLKMCTCNRNRKPLPLDCYIPVTISCLISLVSYSNLLRTINEGNFVLPSEIILVITLDKNLPDWIYFRNVLEIFSGLFIGLPERISITERGNMRIYILFDTCQSI